MISEYGREQLRRAVRQGRVEQLYQAMCKDKMAFSNSLQAAKVLSVVSRYDKRHRDDRKLDVYHCPFCGLLHIGHRKADHNTKENNE